MSSIKFNYTSKKDWEKLIFNNKINKKELDFFCKFINKIYRKLANSNTKDIFTNNFIDNLF